MPEEITPLFAIPGRGLDSLDGAVQLDGRRFAGLHCDVPAVYFDPGDGRFKVRSPQDGTAVDRMATHREGLTCMDAHVCMGMSLEQLKLRLLDMSFGVIPGFQHRIEATYRSLFDARRNAIKGKDADFTAKVRGKAFDRIFADKILPFLQPHGFERHTKTSRRLVKRLANGLSACLFFEYIRFGSGSYRVTLVYFDDDIGTIEHDDYLAHVDLAFPLRDMKARNAELLEFDSDYWLRGMELYVLPFIEKYSDHRSILDNIQARSALAPLRERLGADTLSPKPAYFYELPPSRRERCLEILSRKSALTAKP
ncbi:hypothetical protein [Pseudoxanthomonas kalamensis]|uniref:hypothetical protein n=1 Tax=Pseudoxanthomonas kalamensis TaxID=289483 RepID=UPI001390FCC0|nr:hypothetical protein [Pseudoxanthomonas kalamensis]